MTIKPTTAITAAVLLILAATQVTSAGPSSPSPNRDFPVVVTDSLGRSFTFAQSPKRIVSLNPGYTETLFALGVADRITAVDDYSDFPPEVAEKKKLRRGYQHQHNLEQIISLNPDLVVALVEPDEIINALVAHGIPALKLAPDDFEAVMGTVLLLGRVTGSEPRAREIVQSAKARVQQVQSRLKGLPPTRMFFELDASDPVRPFTAGPNSFIGDLIRTAGGWNIAEGIRAAAGQMSLEAMVAADPDIIILDDAQNPINPQTSSSVQNRPGWKQLKAVQRKSIFQVNAALFSRPGPRLVDGIEQLARLLHPQAFR